MNSVPSEQQLQIYIRTDGHRPFQEWRESFANAKTKAVIAERLDRVTRGLFGDCKTVGKGILELRIDFGPGLRVYLGRHGYAVVILLSGGDKKSQKRDIQIARLTGQIIGGGKNNETYRKL